MTTKRTSGKLCLPWSYTTESYGDTKITDRDEQLLIREVSDYEEADFVDLYPEQAAFIVRAVNHHKALMEIVRELAMSDGLGDLEYRARVLVDAIDPEAA